MTNERFTPAEVINRLAAEGVGFTASHDGPAGKVTIHLSPDQAARYWDDAPAAMAEAYGVTRSQYLGWHSAGYVVQCAGRTTSGRQCRNPAQGGHLVASPVQWIALQGGYCLIHGEGLE
jgi:hypothetical protein